jgi:hypothetical protein
MATGEDGQGARGFRPPGARDVTTSAALTFVVGVAFPGVLRREARRRLRSRRFVVGVVASTLAQFAVRQFLVPWSRGVERRRDELATRLGREPTAQEFADHLRRPVA